MTLTRIALPLVLGVALVAVGCDKKEKAPAKAPVAVKASPTAAAPAKKAPEGTAKAAPDEAKPGATAKAPAPTSGPKVAEGAAASGPIVGKPAPDFTLTNTEGQQVTLSSFKGKTVIVEWFNPDCPFVKYAYNEGPLKTQAKDTASDSIVWLHINSGTPGKQGTGVERNRKAWKDHGLPNPVLLDEDGKVGRLYSAKTTPQLFVVNPDGMLAYMGAIDNAPFGNVSDGGAMTNYVKEALGDLAAGRQVKVSETKSYGCGVKY